MGFNRGHALIAILTVAIGGLAVRQILKTKRKRHSETTLRTDDASAEENKVSRRDSESTLRINDASGEENVGSRGDLESTLKMDDPTTLRMDDVSGEENETLRRDSASTSRMKDAFGEESEALTSHSYSTLRTASASKEEYDVFLSFRGSDTLLNFTDHLHHSLVRAGFRVFLDSEELRDGEKISKVLNALDTSKIYIPIFSRNFASSSWCLREVKHMVKCYSESNGKKDIIPIFYDVKTDDVKLKSDLYKNAILKHREKFASEVQQWETALQTVGGIIGRELHDKREAEQIESIVEELVRKLNPRNMIETENLVNDNVQEEAIMKLLDVGSGGVRFVGIYGMGGAGKTTLAKVIFNKLSTHFEGCCFLEDVRTSSQTHGGLLDLQKKLLSAFVSSGTTDQIKDDDGGIKMIKQVCGNKKVLIVLDNLDEQKQLQNLAGKSDWFGSDSRIIITTREERILKTKVDDSKEILPYEVVGIGFEPALALFCKYAFRSEFPTEEYEDLSRQIVRKVGMLPLAIVVIGSYLFDLGNHMKNSERREVWDDTMEKLEKRLFDDVRKTLMISYERLGKTKKKYFWI